MLRCLSIDYREVYVLRPPFPSSSMRACSLPLRMHPTD